MGIVFSFLRVYPQNSLVNTLQSPYAKLSGIGMGDVQLTKGFWAERFAVCRDVMVPQLWSIYTSDTVCYAFQNFKIAAGLETGKFRGPSFHDGDFYKTLEAVAAMYAATKDKKLDAWMDYAIGVIGKAQKDDGYIYTKAIIEQKKTGQAKMFDDKLSFEAYNFGHLMTAACVHYRATGKTSLLEIAKKCPISKILEGDTKVRTFLFRDNETEKKLRYPNDEITVVWKPEFCQHSGIDVRRSGDG